MRYIVLQRTPVPGYWEAMPTHQIQEAEFNLRLGRHYGERARRIGKLARELYLYTWDDAQQIVEYWREKRSWAAFKLIGHMGMNEGETDGTTARN